MEAGQEQEDLPVYKVTGSDGQVLHVRIEHEPVYRDDLTGQVLPTELVILARAKELEYFESKGVWEKRPLGEARRRTGKPRSQCGGPTSTKVTT